MLYNYCPKCGSLRLERNSDSDQYKCKKCNYLGKPKRDSMDKINDFKKVIDSKNKEDNSSSFLSKPTGLNKGSEDIEDIPLKKKLDNKLSTKKSGDWELL